MSEFSPMTVDLEKIINERAGEGRVPGFIISWAKKFIHQDYINGFLQQGFTGVDFCENCMKYLDVTINVEGMEHLDGFPEDTRFTFVSNHPLGGIDGIALGMVIGRRFDGHIKYLVNDLLMNVKGLAPMCVPVNVGGRQSRDLPRLIDEAFASDDQMIMFPAGVCSRRIDGRIQDREWGKAFINKSVRTGRYVVPIHFIGQNSKRFYRVSTICRKLKLKFNFAMVCLPDEMYRGRHGTYTVRIGKPVPHTAFDSSKTAFEWAQEVRAQAYNL